jgi:hypothetical protein
MCWRELASLVSLGENPLKHESRGLFTAKRPWCISVSILLDGIKRFVR